MQRIIAEALEKSNVGCLGSIGENGSMEAMDTSNGDGPADLSRKRSSDDDEEGKLEIVSEEDEGVNSSSDGKEGGNEEQMSPKPIKRMKV